MTSAGLLTVRSRLREGVLTGIDVALQRPAVARLFAGQAPDTVLKQVPLLYTLCTHAQSAAARGALGAATGSVSRAGSDAGLWTEMLHESLWRLLLDWPAAVGLPVAREAFVAWRRGRFDGDCAARTLSLVHGLLDDLAAQCLERLPDSAEPEVPAAPGLNPRGWLQAMLHTPEELPAPRVPLSIAGAYRARLRQVHAAARALECHAPYPAAQAAQADWGVAQVLTARGVLTHAAQVREGCVLAYRAWAPTDAFFATPGALAALLASARFTALDAARRALDLAVLALDPCVPYVVELTDA